MLRPQPQRELPRPILNSAANAANRSRAPPNFVRNAESLSRSAVARHERNRVGCRSLWMLVAVVARHGCLEGFIYQHHSGDETPARRRNVVAPVSWHWRHHRALPSRRVTSRMPYLSGARLTLPESLLLRSPSRVGFRNCSTAALWCGFHFDPPPAEALRIQIEAGRR